MATWLGSANLIA